MSVRAVLWAFKPPISKSEKLVLVSLAENADASGKCYPSLRFTARRTGMSKRYVRYLVRKLERKGLLRVEPRFRADGSYTSNRYILALPNQEDVSPAEEKLIPSGGQLASGDEDIQIRSLTVNELLEVEPPPRKGQRIGQNQEDSKTASGPIGDGSLNFRYPPDLLKEEVNAITEKLDGLSIVLAQEALYELEGRMQSQAIRNNPVSYLGGIVKRIRAGTFTLEAGIRIKARYEIRAKNKRIFDNAMRLPDLVGYQRINSPLTQRLDALAKQSRRKRSE